MDIVSTAILVAVSKLSEAIVLDIYKSIKSLIRKKYGAKSELVVAIKQLESKPDSKARRDVLMEEIKTSKADQDAELVKRAEILISKVKEMPDGNSFISQIVSGDKNIFSVSGDITIER